MKIYYCELQCKDKGGAPHPMIVSTLAENEDDARAQIKDSMNFTTARADFGEIKEGILYRHCAVLPVGIGKDDLSERTAP